MKKYEKKKRKRRKKARKKQAGQNECVPAIPSMNDRRKQQNWKRIVFINTI